jgi:predicted nucleotidyltransferase
MEKNQIIKNITVMLNERPDIIFGYIHGSFSSSDNPRDIDVAIFIAPVVYEELVAIGEVNLGFAIPLEMELEQRIGKKADVQILNAAPLSFQYRVINSGTVVTDKDSDIRADFECLTRVKYFDFQPRVEEYLREIIT